MAILRKFHFAIAALSLFNATCLLAPHRALASDMSQATGEVTFEIVKLVQRQDVNKIPNFTFEDKPRSIETIVKNGKSIRVARFRGHCAYTKDGNVIYLMQDELKNLRVSPTDGNFEILVPIETKRQTILFWSIDLLGVTHKYGLSIKAEVADEKKTVKKLNFDVGLGFSYLNYVEKLGTTLQFNIVEAGITAKAGMNYVLSKHFEIGGNSFITAYPFGLKTEKTLTGSSPTSDGMTTARWYGINGRIGYKLPTNPEHGTFTIMTGWYVWGMLVPANIPSNTYGVEYLGGPQLLFNAKFLTAKKRAYFGYLKFATIQDSGFASLTNRELAIGGGFQISKPSEDYRRWMLMFDIADARFARGTHTFSLLSASTSVSTNF